MRLRWLALAVLAVLAVLAAARLARYFVPIDPDGFGAPDAADGPWRDSYLDDLFVERERELRAAFRAPTVPSYYDSRGVHW